MEKSCLRIILVLVSLLFVVSILLIYSIPECCSWYHSELSATRNRNYLQRQVEEYMKLDEVLTIFKQQTPENGYKFGRNDTAARHRTEWMEAFPKRNKCAVVGNSGILIGSQCGALIDSHDFVFRLNVAPVCGEFRLDVGSSVNLTTMNRFQWRTLWKIYRTKNGTPFDGTSSDIWNRLKQNKDSIIWIVKGVGSREADNFRGFMKWLRLHDLHVRWAFTPYSMMGLVHKVWNTTASSTGLIAIATSALFCEEISLFGFFPFSTALDGSPVSHHYYEPASKISYETNIHHMPEEYKLLLSLSNEGALRLITTPCKQNAGNSTGHVAGV